MPGAIIYGTGLRFLQRMLECRLNEANFPQEMAIDGMVDPIVHPITPEHAVRLYVHDARPIPDDFQGVYRIFAGNLANRTIASNVIPNIFQGERFRERIANIILDVGQGALHDSITAINEGGGLHFVRSKIEVDLLTLERHNQTRRADIHGVQTGLFDGSTWRDYIRGLLQGLAWLADIEQKHGTIQIWENNAVNLHAERIGQDEPAIEIPELNARARWQLIQDIVKKRITFMGPAVTANFIKDLGFTGYAKPDVQTMRATGRILQSLGQPQMANEEAETFFHISRWAEQAGQPPRALDRVLYLIGSGNFHYHINRPAHDGATRVEQFASELDTLFRENGLVE